MTPTHIMLVAIHKAPIIRLSEICDRYLDNSPETARRKAVMRELPFPAFQIEPDNKKSPWMVRAEDLADFIDASALAGVKSWEHSQV